MKVVNNWNKIKKIVWTQLRYELPLWGVLTFTNFLPDNRITIKLRGALCKPFIKRCGKNFTIARGVEIRSPDRLIIGDNVYIASHVWLNAMGGLKIEDEVVISPFVVISTGIHQFKNGSVRFGGTKLSPIVIGKGSWISSHSVINAGVKVGKGVIVGANSVVLKDVPDNVIVGGIPAQVIRERKENDLNECRIHSKYDVELTDEELEKILR